MRRSCIYQIVNTVTNDFYIGSTVDSRVRKNSHFGSLRRGKHGNFRLQRAWKEYGETAFVFEVVEFLDEVSDQDLRAREQFFLDTKRPKYNISFDTTRPVTSPEGQRIKTDKLSKVFFASYRGEPERRIKNLRDFCRINSLNIGSIMRLLKGDTSHHKGWTFRRENEVFPSYINRREKQWIVTSPQGEETFVPNLALFSRENGLTKTNLQQVAYGIGSHHHGWKCRFAEDSSPRYIDRATGTYEVGFPDGHKEVITGLGAFCTRMGFNKSMFHQVIGGTISPKSIKYKGFTCHKINPDNPTRSTAGET